jgi:EAL domain-containing protein (putative c-di-GMP-specific phosphodiesterase class I)
MQPIYRLRDRVLVGHEFLSRSTVDVFEMPDAFFRLAVEANILSVVDLACLRSCVLAASRTPPLLRRHVNLFPSTAAEIPARQLIEILAKGRGIFCVELSEQQIVHDPMLLTGAVAELRDAGVLVAIDDIGFGRSSLESLVALEPDIVKIDKRCSAHIAEQPDQARILRRLLDVAAALHVEVVLEGIEREEDLRALVDLGVEYGQGFLLGEPVAVRVPEAADPDDPEIAEARATQPLSPAFSRRRAP